MGRSDYAKLGDRNAICDICGFKFKLSQLRKQWDGLMVCAVDWSPEPPQNKIRIQGERASNVDGRPESPDVFLADNEVTADDL